MEGQARGQTSDSDILAQAPGHSSDTVADGRFLIHDIHGAIIIYILIFLLMSVLSHNCCPFVLYYTQFCSGTFLDSPHFHQSGSVSVAKYDGGWLVCVRCEGEALLPCIFLLFQIF